jgi:hypothetical protein
MLDPRGCECKHRVRGESNAEKGEAVGEPAVGDGLV